MTAVAGIELPKGDPGAVESAAGSFDKVASNFEVAANIVGEAERSVPSWQGVAAFTFTTHCGTHGDAGRSGQKACHEAALVLRAFGRELADARDRVRELQRRGEDCIRRIEAADARSGGEDGGQARREADEARAELGRLQQQARDEVARIEAAGRAAAGKVRAAVELLPRIDYWQPPPEATVKEEDGGGGLFSTIVHGVLDVGGFVPVLGAAPDLLNAGIYAAEGNEGDAAISVGAAVPLFGDIGKGAKMAKEGVELATKAGKTADAVADTVRIGDKVLPLFREGGKTEGILKFGDEDIPLRSGYDGPSQQLGRGTPGMHGNIKSHVEAHAAAIFRMNDQIRNGILYINRVPCEGGLKAPGCHINLVKMLPEGAELTVYGPGGFKWVYRGLAD